MRLHLIGALASLLLSGSVWAQTQQEQLSELTYGQDIELSSSVLTCRIIPGGIGSYLDFDRAVVELTMVADGVSVLPHLSAHLSSSASAVAADVCDLVNDISTSAAANGGMLNVSKKVTLSIYRYLSYGGCDRVLQETMEVTLPGGLVVQSYSGRSLSEVPLSECGVNP